MKTRICTMIAFISAFLIWSDNMQAQSPGNALDFDGSNDYVSVPHAAALDITNQITIEGWFKSTSSSWPYKKLVTIDYTKVLASQTNFPVLVSVTDTDLLDSDNGGPVQPDGDDILFLGTDGTKLSHEIEQYDGSTGKLIAWVKVPTLSSVTDTKFYLYYGNSGCSSQQDAANVWSENYSAVYHMNEIQNGTTIFSDGFETGLTNWTTDPTTGWEQATDQFTEGSNSARASNVQDGLFTSNDIDASGASSITVDFWFRKRNVDRNDIKLYFYDGLTATYDSIAILDTMGSDNAWIHFSEVYLDAKYLRSDFKIRFDALLGGGEEVWVDDVKVIADGPEFPDSSPNNKDGERSGTVETTGYIGNAQDFDGVEDKVYLYDIIDSPTQVTLSAWIKHDNLDARTERYISLADKMVIRHDGNNSQEQLHFYIRQDGGTLYDIRVNNVLTTNDTWYYVTGTFDGTDLKVYLDGVQLDSATPLGTTMDDPLYGNISQDSETMDGIIDEPRISSVARDSSWIATEYNNMSSPGTFLSLGSETYVGVVSKSSAYGIGTDNTIAYATINDQSLSASITASEWNHIALTYDKDDPGTEDMKLYINGTKSATGTYALPITTNTDNLILSNFVGLLGKMDDVRLWSVVRTEQEIRENMHRVVDPASANLVAYWQFNESAGTAAADSAGTNNGTLNNMTDADWVASTAPFGGGLVGTTTSFTSGTANLGTFSMTTTDAFDAAVDITATEILNGPNIIPAVADSLDDRYWVVDVFGTPGTYSANLTFKLPTGYLVPGEEANMKLYNRSSNSDGSWSVIVSGAEAGMTDTTVTFNGVSSLGQFTITGSSGFPMPVELTSFTAEFDGRLVRLNWSTATEIINYGFEVQRSSKTDKWDVLGFVEGHGNSYSPKYYEFTDDLSSLSDLSQVDSLKYRLKQIDLDGMYEYYELSGPVDLMNITDVEEDIIPSKFELYQNYPNPFNPATTINFDLPESGKTLLEIYNSIGQKVAVLINRELSAGYHQVEWDASELTSGVYLYRISTERYAEVKKMMLLK